MPDSLYPDDAFKTAYSSLLLLGLVTTGATINNQIYGGILTGALLGMLTPSQIALLQASGPGFTVGNITASTLLISGTVDVLFPLEHSLVNTGSAVGTPGHGRSHRDNQGDLVLLISGTAAACPGRAIRRPIRHGHCRSRWTR